MVSSGQPLIVPDARADDRLRTDPAITALGVVSYAGMPLTDSDGLVLGSLCAIDHRPRTWTDGEQRDLADLTAACSAELRLRILSAQRRSTQKVLETARATAEQARSDTERLEHEAQAGLDHAELLLRASEELAQTSGLEDVRRRLRDLFSGVGKPAYVGLLVAEKVADKQELRRIPHPDIVYAMEQEVPLLPTDAAFRAPGPSVNAARCSYPTARRSSPTTAPRRSPSSTAWASAQCCACRSGAAAPCSESSPYDAYHLPSAPSGQPPSLIITVGDITGHDMHAVTVMGQARSMLRQATLDHPPTAPLPPSKRHAPSCP